MTPYGQGYFAATAGMNFIPFAGFEPNAGRSFGWGHLEGPSGHDLGGEG